MCVFVALGTQHATSMRHILLSSVVCWLDHIFPHYVINGTILWQKVTDHKMCVFDTVYKVFLKQFSFYEELGKIWL